MTRGRCTIDPTARNISGWDQLREAIVMTAVEDMRDTLAGKKGPESCSLVNLKRFFYGEWAQKLLGDVDGKWLYQELLKERYAHGKGAGQYKIEIGRAHV